VNLQVRCSEVFTERNLFPDFYLIDLWINCETVQLEFLSVWLSVSRVCQCVLRMNQWYWPHSTALSLTCPSNKVCRDNWLKYQLHLQLVETVMLYWHRNYVANPVGVTLSKKWLSLCVSNYLSIHLYVVMLLLMMMMLPWQREYCVCEYSTNIEHMITAGVC